MPITSHLNVGAPGVAGPAWAVPVGSARHRAGRGRHPEAPFGPAALGAFRLDLKRGIAKLFKRTSDAHMRVVALVILVGAALRVSLLWEPVLHEEALACTDFAARSFHTVLTDLSYPVNHVLHGVLMRISVLVFGVHLWSIRLPALLAGILVMPLFYVFVRSMFNRYIALIALAFVAGSGCLIEYSAIAQGYSIAWVLYLMALLLGRHLARTNNVVSAVLMALCCALAVWSVPTALYAVIAVHVWVFMQLSVTYRDSLNRRLGMLLFSGLLFLGAVFALYMPVISAHGLIALFHHPTEGEYNWSGFLATHQDRAFDLWAYFNDTAATWLSVLGFVGVLFAVYVSSKFRVLMISLGLGAVPFATLLARVGQPWEWSYVLFMLHLSSGIALFYLLKLVQEHLIGGLTKRLRTVVTAVVVLVGMGWLGMTGIKDRFERFPDAAHAADWLKDIAGAGDRVLVEHPWEAPLSFHLLCDRMDLGLLASDAPAARELYVLVGPADGQTLRSVLTYHRMAELPDDRFQKVQDWARLEIYRRR